MEKVYLKFPPLVCSAFTFSASTYAWWDFMMRSSLYFCLGSTIFLILFIFAKKELLFNLHLISISIRLNRRVIDFFCFPFSWATKFLEPLKLLAETNLTLLLWYSSENSFPIKAYEFAFNFILIGWFMIKTWHPNSGSSIWSPYCQTIFICENLYVLINVAVC